jgi:tetratricopeptide (TPR) repeat protein
MAGNRFVRRVVEELYAGVKQLDAKIISSFSEAECVRPPCHRVSHFETMKLLNGFLLMAIACVLATGCEREANSIAPLSTPQHEAIAETQTIDFLALALVPHEGDGQTDKEIRRFQEQVRRGINREAALERLGWAYVGKAHESFDAGFYKLAEACANVLEADTPGCAEGLLLRGHVLQNLHRFKEAYAVARELTAKRGLSFDFALLGDSLMEQGRLKEAVAAYQAMVDLRPDLQAYSRIAHVRWLTGDLAGATEMMQAAVSASSPRDADSAAWVNSRLATLQLLSGATETARQSCETALELRPNYPPALLLRGKMAMQQDDFETAITDLQSAAEQNPLPEYQWALAEALRADGRETEAAAAENMIATRGETADPRLLSLYLATRGENSELAVRLAGEELQERADVFTHDAMAWALAAAGRIDDALPHLERALAEGTQDARLFFHAAVIHSRAGHTEQSEKWFTRAVAMSDLLLPSERSLLLKLPDNFAAMIPDAENSSALPLSASSN